MQQPVGENSNRTWKFINPLLEGQVTLFACFKDTGTGCRIQGEQKTQTYRKSHQAEMQHWRHKGKLEHAEDNLLGEEQCRWLKDKLSGATQCGGLGRTQTWKATWLRVTDPKGLGTLLRKDVAGKLKCWFQKSKPPKALSFCMNILEGWTTETKAVADLC